MTARCGLILGFLGLGAPAWASSSAGEEWLTLTDAAPPNILFVVDLSTHMSNPCEWGGDESFHPSDDSCIEDVEDAIDHLTKHYDWARYGVVGTTGSVDENGFTKIVPLGASHSELSAAVDGLSDKVASFSDPTRNLAEVISTLADEYFSNTAEDDDEIDSDGDGYTADWTKAPIQYACQQNHIVVLTGHYPHNDADADSSHVESISPDVKCTEAGITTGTDEDCLYDNVVAYMNETDFRSDLSGTNNVKVHTVALGVGSTSIAETLFGNASDATGGDGIYTSVDDGDEIIGKLMFLMRDIRSGFYSRSSPVVSADGAYLIYTYYQLGGTLTGAGGAFVNPLGEGHIRAYEIEDDPTSSEYGQVQYDGDSDIGGALWDGGELLVSRIVTSGEANPGDLDGIGRRDIFTFWEDAVSVMSSESTTTRRQGLDADFVAAVGASSTLLDKILDTDEESDGTPSDSAYDLNQDNDIDEDDLQALVDFIRGYPDAWYRYLGAPDHDGVYHGVKKGYWKLLDSPHSVPLVIQARDDQYSMDVTYRKFLSEMEANDYPDMVYLAANDGMLHAFFLENLDDGDADSEQGQEAWAWMPSYLLEREHEAEWAGRAIDMVLYGRTFLMDGTPVAEDVWIDADGDNTKDCDAVPDDCEWHRVIVVQQGKGGPVTLALDITNPTDPKFLWEQTDETDSSAMGYTVGRPVIANIYDASGSEPHDRWVAMWGSGRAVPLSTSTAYYKSSEANLYMWHVGDSRWIPESSYLYSERGDNGHPEASSAVNMDSDSNYEYGYIAAALAVVDVDSDGDADTVYFPVTASYTPTDEGGDGPSSPKDPGSTWMYKGCIDTTDPDDLTWVEFYDPDDDGDLGHRPEVYYAATTSWHTDGQLGVYWGTGTPYDRDSSKNGYFFAVKDSNPKSCTSFDVNPITDCGSEGVYQLDEGEGLTSDPIVYANVVYFTTWVPDEDRCEGGTGRLYGLDFTDCSEGIDTNGDGDLDSSDTDYVEHEDEYLSSVAVTEQGTIIYGTSNPTTDGSGAAVETIEVVNDPFLGTAAMAWMEVF